MGIYMQIQHLIFEERGVGGGGADGGRVQEGLLTDNAAYNNSSPSTKTLSGLYCITKICYRITGLILFK